MKLRNVADFGIIDAILVVWAISYFMTLVARPDMYAAFSLPLSAAFLAILGILLIFSVLLDMSAVYFFMSIGYIYGFIISWTGAVTWNVPYDPGTAAVSMALIDFFIASLLMYKAFRTSTLSAPTHHPQPEQEILR
ncbi:MAG: hypothetical protein R6U10_04465 [Thermoplasmatota archaeon]